MTEAQIKLKRTESVLCELIPEAFGNMNDKRFHQLEVIDVKCSRGKSDAKVYINPAEFTEDEKRNYIKLLNKARPIIETYCLKDQGWFRCPKFTFEFDTHLKEAQNIEELFKKIAKNKEGE